MHKNNGSAADEDQIWLSRQPDDVQPEAQPALVKKAPHRNLGRRVFGPDGGHYLAAAFAADMIHARPMRF